jgi:hypothetical protein
MSGKTKLTGGNESGDFFARATSHTLKPTIVNAKSNFVVVTYWWGRGNLNKNTQRPCPEDLSPGDELTLPPIKFEQMISNWEDSCKTHKCNFLAEEYPEFAVKGGYQHAINFKPYFIDLALQACYPRGVLYIDGDMKIKMYPAICDTKDVDYMARGWNTDSRPALARAKPNFCFDPYVFETSGGTMFFGNTQNGRNLLKFWQTETKKYPGKADDRILSMAIAKYDLLVRLTTIQLPIEYLWLDLDYDVTLKKGRDYKESKIAISHPECLTGEDRAASEGASSNRYPPRYFTYTDDHLMCDWEEVYEYIQFDTKSMVSAFKPYLDWLDKNGVADIIPYSKKYGSFNDVAKKNEELMKGIELKIKNSVVFVSPHEIESTSLHQVKDEREIIPTILKYIENGQHVVYVPGGTRSVRTVVAKAAEESLDFVTRNENENKYRGGRAAYTLKLDHSYPIYFGPNSNTLKHWLRMSESIKAMEKLFNRTYLFLTRIHCGWT